jgi:hypothetical protein
VLDNVMSQGKPRIVKISCILLSASAAMLVVWIVSTWSKQSQFDRAVEFIFNAVQDADTTVAWLQFLYFVGVALSIVFAGMFVLAAIFIYHGSNWARVLAWIVGPLSLPFTWLTLIRNGVDYLNALGTGPSDAAAREEMAKVNQLTPWRFTGWYHMMTVTFGIAIACSILAALVMLSLPSSNAFFRKVPLSDLISGGWGRLPPP